MRRLGRDTWTLIGVLVVLLIWLLVVHVLAAEEPAYDRNEWLPGWADDDGDCQDTRHEVLARESFHGTTTWDAAGCKVMAGWWRDPYTGESHRDPAMLDIDHVIPLAWAHAHGGHAWTRERKRAFANELGYPGALIPTTRAANRAKQDKGPDQWIPKQGQCAYGTAWAVMLFLYPGLDATSVREPIRLLVEQC